MLGGYDTRRRTEFVLNRKEIMMKKLMTLMLGLSLSLGSVAVAFAQDQPKKEDEGGKKKKGKKKKDEEPKKEAR